MPRNVNDIIKQLRPTQRRKVEARYADLFSEDERRAMQRKVQERRHLWREEQIAATMAQTGALAN